MKTLYNNYKSAKNGPKISLNENSFKKLFMLIFYFLQVMKGVNSAVLLRAKILRSRTMMTIFLTQDLPMLEQELLP